MHNHHSPIHTTFNSVHMMCSIPLIIIMMKKIAVQFLFLYLRKVFGSLAESLGVGNLLQWSERRVCI